MSKIKTLLIFLIIIVCNVVYYLYFMKKEVNEYFIYKYRYYPNGSILEKKSYLVQHNDTVPNGVYENYYDNGVCLERAYYLNGKKNGNSISYDSFGNLNELSYFVNDSTEGTLITFHQNSFPAMKAKYKAGRIMDIEFIKDSIGNNLKIGAFNKGNGYFYVYDGHKVSNIYVVKDGLREKFIWKEKQVAKFLEEEEEKANKGK